MKKKTSGFALVISILLPAFAFAQDIHFSQFYRCPLLYNAAATGDMDRAGRAVVMYKSQWQAIENGYVSYLFSADAQLKPEWLKAENIPAIGILVFKDSGGELKYGNVSGSIFLADHLMVNGNQKLSFAIRGGFGKTSMELSGWQWGSQYDGEKYDPNAPGETPGFLPKSYGDVGAGAQYTWGANAATMSSGDQQSLRIGIYANHLNRPRLSLAEGSQARLPVRYTFSAVAYLGQRNNELAFLPSMYYSFQAGSQELVLGSNMLYRLKEASKYTNLVESNGVGFGLFMRWKDAIIPSVYYESERFQIGFSYDVNISSFKRSTNSNGGFEVSLRYGIRSLESES